MTRLRSARWEQRSFVVEGPKLVAEALAAGVAPEAVYLDSAGSAQEHRELAEQCRRRGAVVFDMAPGVLARASDTVTPQPLSAIVPMPGPELGSLAGSRSVVVVCVGVQDPGNAGAVVRSASASGAAAVVFCLGAVDIYNPKAVRSSAGAVFHLPVVAGPSPEVALDELGAMGFRRLGCAARGGRDPAEVDLTGPLAVVLGSESHGIPEELAARVDGWMTIPMAARTESLNVAMAAAVICFEASRQRRTSLGASKRGARTGGRPGRR